MTVFNQYTQKHIKTIGITFMALIAFSANSVLCRMALKETTIDASGFTVVRLLSAVLMLFILFRIKSNQTSEKMASSSGSWTTATMLFIYAIALSFAYISLDTGIGALVLFGAVQLTMITAHLMAGNSLRRAEWLGVSISFAGLAYLIYPTITTPSIIGFILMGISGVAWGLYTLAGRGSVTPLADTKANFNYTIPFFLILTLVMYPWLNLPLDGVILAVLSGAFASAIGYTLWYIALADLSATEAAVVQLSVPILASFGGVIWISEPITLRLIISCILVLGGIFIVITAKKTAITAKK